MTQNVAILVLNYNGRALLEQCLPSIVAAAATLEKDQCRVVVVDNASGDDSVHFVRDKHRNVEIAQRKKNDFLFSLNPVVAKREEEFVMIMNNDMSVAPDYLRHLLRHMQDGRLFAVTCGLRDWDGKEFSLASRPPVCTVRPAGSWYSDHYEMPPNAPAYVQVASGGASLFRREMFVALGGFDPLYRPGYCEDTDLSIRAWRNGWRIMYEPSSVVHHLGSISMKRRYGSRVHRIGLRNRILMTAKLFGDGWQHAAFLTLLPKRMVQNLCSGRRNLGLAMLEALPKLPTALISRRRMKRSIMLSAGPPYKSEQQLAHFAGW